MDIHGIINTQSSNCSNVCRQIVFALSALVWALMSENNKSETSEDDKTLFIALLFVIVYFIFEIFQYFYSYLKMRKISFMLEKSEFHPDYTEDDKMKIKIECLKRRETVQNITHILFIVKICVIPIILGSLLCYLYKI